MVADDETMLPVEEAIFVGKTEAIFTSVRTFGGSFFVPREAVFRGIFDGTQGIISGGSYLVLISATNVRACGLDDI